MIRIFKSCLRLVPLALIIAFVLSIIGPSTVSANPGWYNASWLYRKKITINAANVTATQTNFPVLISITSDTGLGTHAQLDADDILFTEADEVTKLSHEIEKYSSNGATANLTAWVKVPSVSSVTNIDIYMYYGNAGAANQQDAINVWDTNYKVVQHMEETAGGANAIKDSTVYNNNGTDNNSPTFGATGKIDGAISFDGTNDYIGFGFGNSANITRPLTIEVWIKPNTVPSGSASKPIVFRDDGARMNYSLSIASGTYTGGTGVKTLFWREDVVDTDNKTYGTTEIAAGNWYHIVVVDAGSQGVNGNFSIYVNGGSPEGVLSCNLTAYDGPTHKLTVADTNGERIGGGAYFNGIIDEVRISNSARSANWIKTSFNNQNNPASFITLGPEQYIYSSPTVTTVAASLVEETTADLHGTLTSDGGEACQFSFEWGTTSGVYTANISWNGSITTGQSFSTSLGSLTKGQAYYYRAKVKNSAGIGYGSELNFLTKPDEPTALAVTSFNSTQISLSWTKGAGADRTKVMRKLGSYPTNYNDGTQVYFSTGTSFSDTPLPSGTTFYYRAWSEITVGANQQWSDIYASITASTTGAAAVTTNAATAEQETTATLNGTLTNDGGEACQYSFEWGTAPGVYTANISWTGSITTGQTFSTNLIGLTKGQPYYYRAKVMNSAGIAYGGEIHFLTKPDGPVILTATANSSSRIDLSWTKGTGAGRTMIRRAEGAYPVSYTDGTEVYFDTGTSFSDTGLSANTTYYYRGWSEKTGSQQWSNTFVNANAQTFAAPPAPPSVIGGKVFSVNKAVILAPWLLLAAAFTIVLVRVILYFRKKTPSHRPPEKTP